MVDKMDLKKVMDTERIKLGKKMMQVATVNYTRNRTNALKTIDEEELKKKIRKIKEYSISNLDKLKKQAIKNLESRHVKVFEAKDAKEARKIALKLIPKGELIVKSKSNTIKEIELLDALKGRNELWDTDCGDFIVQITEEHGTHCISPALHIPMEKITKTIKEKFGVKVKPNPKEITGWVREFLREKMINAKIGLTGANFISADGAIFIIENEGNISLVTKLPERHIIFAGIDKIIPTIEDGMSLSHAAGIWGSGVTMPGCISVIGSPSKTADIKKELVWGMHGAKEVYLILIDNGRMEMIKEGFEELLYCINCGACLYPCPVYKNILDNYGLHYFGGRGIGLTVFQEGLKKGFDRGMYYCTTCELCKQNCPMDIDIPKIIKKLRSKAVKKNLETPVNSGMMDNVRTAGNPFGEEVKEGKLPDKLYCC
ncbi:MAG: lactate utilization protein [Candidatus Aenigmarchaeota archaeon]|nr:lactate utilization protein [Candidatus Aenigmarchaeota archaeon]